ncbi:MAG: hypothetical protein ABFD64_14105 [Armatimonadota bacterium]
MPLILGVVLSVAAIAVGGKSSFDRMLVVKPPVIKMPSPNAYDYFVFAGKSLVDVEHIRKASLEGTSSESETATLVEKNQAALGKLREGLKYDYQQPFKYGIEAIYPEYNYYRNLSHLLALESQVKLSKGDWTGAVDSCQDGLMLGEMVAHGDSNSVGRLVGIACQKAAGRHIWDAIPQLTSAQAKDAVARMQDIEKHHFPLYKSLEREKISQLLFLQDCFNGKCKDAYVKDWDKLPDQAKIRTINDYTHIMDQCIRNVQLQYASKPVFPEVKGNSPTTGTEVTPEFILSIIYPVWERFWFADTYNQTRKEFLTVSFALQAYHADHGNYPAKLSELCPGYLKSVPDDLFTLKAPLSYRLDGDKYTLWSVGPDCVNNNGVPVVNPKAKSDTASEKYYVDQDSKGDIVAGINM